MSRHALPLLGVIPVLAALGSGAVEAASSDMQRFDQIEKGRYLAIAADCGACHEGSGGVGAYAGGRPIETPFGDIAASNITPDTATGIGAWSDAQFVDAVREGIRPDGKRLYPAMPYTAYTKMSRDDVLAIRAYLQTIQPVHHPVESNRLPFPFSIRAAMRAWDWLYFSDGTFVPRTDRSADWNRGAYLVTGPGHCGTCHTPKTLLGGDKSGEDLAGAALQGWFAPNLTGDRASGLGGWSADEIAAYLRSGHNASAGAVGPMAEEIADSSSQMNEADLRAIGTYLKSLPAWAGDAAPAADAAAVTAGQAIYRDTCSACHGLDGKGVDRLFPALATAPAVRASDPTGLIRIVLRGARSVGTDTEPTAPGMPAFGWQLDDTQVAAVLTYIRQAWNSRAGPVSATEVRKARSALTRRSD